MIKLSYLITIHNEIESFDQLMSVITSRMNDGDEIIILDDYSDNPETISIIDKYKKSITSHVKHLLNNNYGEHKNYGTSLCKGDYIFQIDGDEVPSEDLILNVKDILSLNKDTELFFIPRINDYIGVTDTIANTWGWRLSVYDSIVHTRLVNSNDYEITFLKKQNALISCTEKDDGKAEIKHYSILVNYPDYQGRIYKNDIPRIKWDRRLHEKITGHKSYSFFPQEYFLSLYHRKPIEKQIQTNIRYNKLFSAEENMGHVVM